MSILELMYTMFILQNDSDSTRSLMGQEMCLERSFTTSTAAKTSCENVISRFCNHFSIIPSHYACKMCFNYPGIKLEPALQK